MNRTRPKLTCILLLLLLTTTPAAAQERAALADESAGAIVGVREVAVLSFEGLSLAPDLLARVFALPGGGWGVSSVPFDGVVQTFDSTGGQGPQFGRRGEGPGEFAGWVFGSAVGDEIWIVDPRNVRLSVWTRGLEFTTDRRVPGRVFAIAPAADGESLLVSGFMQGDGATHAVARVSLNEAADVFGGVPEGENPRVQVRSAVETDSGEVWTFAVSGGALEILRSSDLSTMERLRLPHEAMTQEAPQQLDLKEKPPVPQVSGVTRGTNGNIWLALGVADRNWAPQPDLDEFNRVYDTRVLVIDPARRAVVAQTQLDELCMPVRASRLSCVDELGESIRIIELVLNPDRRGNAARD